MMALNLGRIIGNRYRVDALLGEGGMGAVYRAWDLRLQVPVALKQMAPQPGLAPQALSQLRQQFEQEAVVLARLKHPYLVRVSDFFEEGGSAYLVMDFVEGESLADKITREGAQPEARLLEWAAQLLSALVYCHAQGVVHRDIKPQNIIIRHEGQAILVDFGLVKLWDPNDPRTKTVMRGMGTPEYAPPEQYDLSLGHTDPRSDLYSLGATLYHALTGQAPPTATQRIASLEAFRAPREMNSRISPRAEAAVLRAMELPVAKRFATAEEMAAALPGPALAPVSLRRVPPKPARAKTMPEAAPPSVPSRRHVPRWVWGMGAVGALVVIAVGAWGLGLFGDGRGASRDLPQPTAAPEVEATIAPRPTATARSEAAALAKTQALHLAACCSGSDFYSVDPARTAFDYTTVQITSEAFIRLLRLDGETLAIGPGMAEFWEVSEDQRVWHFGLRPGIPWVRYDPETHRVEPVRDGRGEIRVVTASDFEYGIKRMLDPETGSDYAYILSPIAGADAFMQGAAPAEEVAVRALDDATLEVRLAEPFSNFDMIAAMWLMAQPSWQIEAQGEQWVDTGNFQGYGPYILKEWVHDQRLTLIKNPFWPGIEGAPQPIIEEITWTLMDGDQALDRYRAGDLDVVTVDASVLPQILEDPDLKRQLFTRPSSCTYYYGFNVQKPPTDDPRVRQAFSLAVDRKALVQEALQGDGEPANTFSIPGMRAAPSVELAPELGAVYDPEQARQLLDEVYPDRSRMPPVELVVTGYPSHEAIAEVIRRMWAETLGVEVNLRVIAQLSEYYDLLETDAPNIWRLGWCADYPDAHSFLDEGPNGPLNFFFTVSHWSPDDFVRLLEDAATGGSVAQRTAWYTQAETILVRKEAAMIPLYWYTQSVLTQPYLSRTFARFDAMEQFEKWSVMTH